MNPMSPFTIFGLTELLSTCTPSTCYPPPPLFASMGKVRKMMVKRGFVLRHMLAQSLVEYEDSDRDGPGDRAMARQKIAGSPTAARTLASLHVAACKWYVCVDLHARLDAAFAPRLFLQAPWHNCS